MKRRVRDLIGQKGLGAFWSVAPSVSVAEALTILEASNCSAILVVENGRLRGIFSEKDFARASLSKGIRLTDCVGTIMSTKVYYVEPTFSLEECLQVMSKVHVRHLPVIEHGRPIALVSMRHVMEVLVDDKEAKIRELVTYITGSQLDVDRSQVDQRELKVYSLDQKQEAI
ncbi:MAG: CBS domain-containing protein [Bdellovibrionales bacterium]|nr:CBS domain-containing protein [Bdellovibrionales bacterium]